MLGWVRTLAVCGLPLVVSGCASFEIVQDPRFGAVAKEKLPKLLKSLRCELTTFYTANKALRDALDARRRQLASSKTPFIPLHEVLAGRYFDLDEDAYGSFSLDIKAQDTIGIPGAATSVAGVISPTMGHSKTLTIGPSASAQATYDNLLWFAIPQNASLKLLPRVPEDVALTKVFEPGPVNASEEFSCFRATVAGYPIELAEGKYPNLELFDRILVDAKLPLAAWLIENGQTMGASRNLLSDAHAEEQKRPAVPVDPAFVAQATDGGQLAYTFTVQYTGGLGAKFSLISTAFNPLTAELTASVQQTGILNIYVNGYQAATAIGAKAALVAISPKPPNPTRVIIIGDERPPKAVVGSAAQTEIKKLVEKNLAPGFVPGSAPLTNFMKELSKDQAAPGQSTITKNALGNLALDEKAKQEIESAIQEKTKRVESRPRVIEIPAEPSRSRQNDGRGVFRFPLGFPLQ